MIRSYIYLVGRYTSDLHDFVSGLTSLILQEKVNWNWQQNEKRQLKLEVIQVISYRLYVLFFIYQQGLNEWQAGFLIFGSTVGAGIFILPPCFAKAGKDYTL